MQRNSFFSVEYVSQLYQSLQTSISWYLPLPKETNQARLDAIIGFCYEDIPDEYIDPIHSNHIMDRPVLLDGRHITDFYELRKWWQISKKYNYNPLTNEPCKSIKFLSELQQTINTFVKNKENVAESKRKAAEAKEEARKLEERTKQTKRENKLKELEDLCKELKLQLKTFIRQLEQRIPDRDDEERLNELLSKISDLNEKIEFLSPDKQGQYNPDFLQRRIKVILDKKERTEKDEKELKKLTRKLDFLHEYPFCAINSTPGTIFKKYARLLAEELPSLEENKAQISRLNDI